MTDKPAIEKVRDWIKTQGQHLEFRVADRFAGAGFTVLQGLHVPSESGAFREIDVLAFSTRSPGPFEVRFAAMVECKYSKDKPWVVLSNTNVAMAVSTIAKALPGNAQWERAVPLVLERADQLFDGPILQRTARHAFGARQAHGGRNDIVYEALRSIVTKTREALRESVPGEDATTLYVALPVVVIDAPLFEAFWSRDAQDVTLEPRPWSRLYWTGDQAPGSDGIQPTAIDIVTSEALDEYLTELKRGVRNLLTALEALGAQVVLGIHSERE